MAKAWQDSADSAKQDAIKYAHSKGAYVVVSAGGATDSPYEISGTDYGTNAAKFAKTHFLDGVDFDLENFEGGFRISGKTAEQSIEWVVNATNAARKVLGDTGIIAHAPQAPYFGKIGGGSGNTWTGTSGGYSAVYKSASHIDYFLVQFYNQGTTCYMTYKGIFEDSGSECPVFPGTSVKEIAAYGIPMEKIVLGKPVRQSDASNGQMSTSQLNAVIKQANLMGWNSGIMGWLYRGKQESGEWIQAIYPNSTNAAVVVTTTAAVVPQTVVNTTVTPVTQPQPAVVTPTVATPAPVVTVTKPQTAPVTTAPVTTAPVATPAPAAQAPQKGSCVSANGIRSDAWCKALNCSTIYIKTGFCKLV